MPGLRLAVLYACAAAATGAAWLWLAGAALAVPHHHGTDWRAFLYAVVMWQAMVMAMMTPTVLPWVAVFDKLTRADGRRSSPRSVTAFAGGYFVIWLAYSAAAAVLQLGLQQLVLLVGGRLIVPLAGAVLIVAGTSQFLPMKRACLSHCRNPLTYFLARWKHGPTGGFRLGVVHGAYCLGCCWLVMLSGFSMGLMNLAWMAVLTVVLAVEQAAPQGERVGRLFGVGLAVWGLALLI